MKIESPEFEQGGRIPQKYTCDGDKALSPPLAISEVPDDTMSLVLIMDDPDVPTVLMPEGNFTHWVLFNIPPETMVVPEGKSVGTPGANTSGKASYTGPCPPKEHEPSTHRYFFKLYALDSELHLQEGATKENVEAAMGKHILATSELVGTYSKV